MNGHRTNLRRGRAPVATGLPVAGLIVSLVAGLFLGVAGAALAGEPAPRRPPEPFPVFVHAIATEDAEHRARLREAVAEVSKRIERRRRWLRPVESPEDARVILQVTNYRTVSEMALKRAGTFVRRGMVVSERPEIVELHYVDAVASAGELQRALSGLDRRRVGTSLRNASDQLAAELERFCRDHYAALTDSPR